MAALSKAELAALAHEVTIDAHDEDEQAGILAIWARGGIRQAIGVVGLPLPEPPPAARSGSTPIVTGWAEPHGKGPERASADGAGLG